MNILELTAEHLAYMPVFPLPKVTFLPDTTLPLHIFEPRYRALTAHCLLHDWPMAVATIQTGTEGTHAASPPFASPRQYLRFSAEGLRRLRILVELERQPPQRGGSDLPAFYGYALFQCRITRRA